MQTRRWAGLVAVVVVVVLRATLRGLVCASLYFFHEALSPSAPIHHPCCVQNAYAMRKTFATGERAAAEKAAAAADKVAADKQQTPDKAGAAARKGGKRR